MMATTSAMAATGAVLRLHLLFRVLQVGELIALTALFSGQRGGGRRRWRGPEWARGGG